ncbi:hypothetical protein [Thermococcus sp.]
MRFITKSEAIKDAFISELRAGGISFDVKARPGYDAFVGYSLEGTLDEIGAKIQAMDGGVVDRELIMEGFLTFKEEIARMLERLRDGEHFEALLGEGHWAGDILDQLARNGALDLGDVIRLKEGIDVSKLRFQFKFPFELAGNPEEIEKTAKQFAFVDLIMEYEIEIKEISIERINRAVQIAGKYFDEEELLEAYFALISRGIVANEILKALGKERFSVDDIVRSFMHSAPLEIPTERGTLVIVYTEEAVREILRLLEKDKYVDIKAGKVRRLRSP